jgi:hypothetical protein
MSSRQKASDSFPSLTFPNPSLSKIPTAALDSGSLYDFCSPAGGCLAVVVHLAALAAGDEGARKLKKRRGNRRFVEGVGAATGAADRFRTRCAATDCRSSSPPPASSSSSWSCPNPSHPPTTLVRATFPSLALSPNLSKICSLIA